MKLIGIDLDGTLLDSNQKISEGNIVAIRQTSKDALPFICSGREVRDIENILTENKINIPAIGLNGAIGYDKGKKIFEFTIDNASVKKAWQVLAGYPIKIYTDRGSYETEGYVDHLKSVYKEIGGEFSEDELYYELEYEKSITSKNVKDIDGLIGEGIKIYKLFIFVPNVEIKHYLTSELIKDDGMTVTESSAVNIEIVAHNVSKGNVFGLLEKHYQILKSTRYAIGDSLNDYSLFEASDCSFVMENGHDELKKIASYHVESNDNDGVAQALEIIESHSL